MKKIFSPPSHRFFLFICLIACLVFTSVFTSCSQGKDLKQDGGENAASGSGADKSGKEEKLSVVCTSFAAYDWVCNITGSTDISSTIAAEKWEITRLNENGADMHSYQPSAKDIALISKCDLLVYTGGISEDWLTKLAGDDFKGRVYNMMKSTDEAGHDHSHEDGEVCSLDEHIWLSPERAAEFCSELAEEISSVDPSSSETYEKNALIYADKLKALDMSYKDAIRSLKGDTLIFADRFPFHYLTEDYGLSYFAAFPGCSAETEASFDTVISLAEKVNELNVPALIITEHSSDSVAETIIKTAGRDDVKIYEMNSLQAVSREDVENGLTYIGAMEDNLAVIKKALGGLENRESLEI